MLPQSVRRSSLPRFDALEVLVIAVGVLVVIAVALVF